MQEYLTHSEAETEQAGADFARALPDGKVVAMYGELGSGKTAFVRARLEQEGFTQDQIDELHLPIGVAIEAEDPEEIAISIAAEMIHLRRTKLVPRKR